MFCSRNEALKFKLPVPRQSTICANQPAGGFVQNTLDCKLFFVCGDNGEVLQASCPSNVVFNPLSKLCDTIANVPQCREPQNSPGSSAASSNNNNEDVISRANNYCYEIYSQEPDSNDLVFFANPQNCYQYFMCYHGQALVQECSTNLYWNAKIGKCDLPSKVECIQPVDDFANSVQVATAGESYVSSDDSISICPHYGHHIFPHMQRCDFFIYCVNGYVIIQQCPFFHYFDVESGRCKLRTHALCIKDLNLKFRKTTF